ncbi:type VI secretion system ATPase TssH [Desulfococcaceae bacterium HSG7]|nr:type VI secretion system ATPase TssH [Desulfococcaceae bacterium HSG7]
MIIVDIKGLLTRLNSFCASKLQDAAGLCVARTHYEVTAEHFFIKLLEDQGADWAIILRQFNIEAGRLQKLLQETLEDFATGNAARPTFSPLLLELLQDAWMLASIDLASRKIRSGTVLLAFLAKPALFASGRYTDLIKTIGRETLMQKFWTLAKVSSEHTVASDSISESNAPETSTTPGTENALKRFCVDFTQRARQGKIDPVFGRDAEIRQMIDILARRRKNNPICVGEPGVGKTALVEGLALRITRGDVPDLLRDVTLLCLDIGLLEAGAGIKGEFEKRLKAVMDEIKASVKPIILFIDEAHTLVGAGGTPGGSDAANLLKPALTRGELRTVAATTWKEYKKYFEKDAALARRFQPIKLDEPSVTTTTLILRGLKANYEKAHQVMIRDDAIKTASELADRYITGRFMPDKAIDLLDTGAARVKINLTAKPPELEDKERAIRALERKLTALERDRLNGLNIDTTELTATTEEIEKLINEASVLKKRWQKEKTAAHKVIELRDKVFALKESDATADTKESAPLSEEQKDAPTPKEDSDRLKEDSDRLRQEFKEARQELEVLQGDAPLIHVEATPAMMAQIVADQTGIPKSKIVRDQAQSVLEFEDRLKESIIGQNHAVAAITQVVKSARSGLKDPAQPEGVFLLVGPSGVGKTETALSVADILFGGERAVVSVNLSEFQEKHTVSRLIGSPPGYVGFGEGGILTEAVRQKPYSVVLLDEVEKAHPDVLNLFYQVFDKGVLADGEGREIDFKNTILFMTGNLTHDIITAMCEGDRHPTVEDVVEAIRPTLSQHFKPALVARMTVIPYYTLKHDAMQGIVRLKLDKLVERMQHNNKMQLLYTPALVESMAARCTETESGARNIDFILNSTIMPRMSHEILTRMSTGGLPSGVNLDIDEEGNFITEFYSET